MATIKHDRALWDQLPQTQKAYPDRLIWPDNPVQRAKATLSTEASVSQRTVMRLAQALSPREMMEVIATRKANSLAPLPYCQDSTAINSFANALAAQNLSDWNEVGYRNLKKEACSLVCFGLDQNTTSGNSAATYLAKAEYWMVAMMQYKSANSGHFKHMNQFLMQLKSSFRSLFNLLWKTFKLLLSACIGLLLVGMANFFIFNVLPLSALLGLFVVALTMGILALVLKNRTFSKVAGVIAIVCLIILHSDYLLLLLTIGYLKREFPLLSTLFWDMTSAFSILIKRTAQSIAAQFNSSSSRVDLHARCDDAIARLAFMEDGSAHEKAEVLQLILDQVDEEEVRTPATMPVEANDTQQRFRAKLSQPYSIFYHGKTHDVSFEQIAATRRSNATSFEMPSSGHNDSRSRFFSTSTSRMLPTLPSPEVESPVNRVV